MISKRLYVADGSTSRFLSDFIIRSVQFARPYVYVYDNTLPVNGTGDVLQDITKPWSYPDNLYKRGVDTPASEDLVTVDKWNVVDNSILFYTKPIAGTSVWVEVASSVEEFGNTLTAPSVERAETAAVNAKTSETNAAASATNALTSENNAKLSETNSTTSAANALVSENSAKTSETNSASSASSASLSESNAASSATNATLSESNASTSATNAALSENNTKLSETNAKTSETNAAKSAESIGHAITDTITTLRASTSSPLTIYVTGYHTKGDGAFGSHIFEWDATSTEADNGGTIIKVTGITTGRYKLKYDGSINVKWFGAKGDGVTDDRISIQNSIDLAKVLNSSVFIPSGTYLISSTIYFYIGIQFYGESLGAVNTSSNSSISGSILKATTSGMTMIRIIGSASEEIIKNCSIKDISLDGNFLAYRGLHISTAYNSIFSNIRITSLAGAQFAFQLDDGNGNISLMNDINNIHYNGTANAASINSNGFAFKSTNSTGGGCVQNKIKNCSALVQDGVAWAINGSDNNVFESIQSYVTGAGYGVKLQGGGVGAVYARNNQFLVPVTPFIAETGTYGNQIFTVSSEVLNITAQIDSQLHYEVFDYLESSIYETHKYKADGYASFNASQMQPTGTASRAQALSLWDSIKLTEGNTEGVIFNMPPQYDFKNGKITNIEIGVVSDGANTSGTAQIRYRIEPLVDNFAPSTPNIDASYNEPINDTANSFTLINRSLGANSVSLGTDTLRGIAFRIERIGASAGDTITSNLYITHIRLRFEFDGAINGGVTNITLPYKNF